MPKVKDILSGKGPTIHYVEDHISVLEATHQMNDHQIGALVVVNADQQVAGIFTERDVLRRVVAEQRDPAATPVGEVMTRQVVCAGPDMDLEEVSSIMQQRRIRHVPVVDDGSELLGMISIGDLNAFHASNRELTIRYLNEYIRGRV